MGFTKSKAMNKKYFIFTPLLFLLMNGFSQTPNNEREEVQVVYVLGNVDEIISDTSLLANIQENLKTEAVPASVVFSGMHTPIDSLSTLLSTLQYYLAGYPVNVYAVPGEGDWKKGMESINAIPNLLKKAFGKDRFEGLEDGCPLRKVTLNATTDMLLVDSQWVLMDWDRVTNINAYCDIKTKTDFYTELEHEIVKSQGKTVIIAMHHPIVSYGKYGGDFNVGINPQKINNKHYSELSKRLLTIAQQYSNILFLGAHESSTQFIQKNNVPVVITGAPGNSGRIVPNKNLIQGFTAPAYSKLIEYKDGSWDLQFCVSGQPPYSAPLFNADELMVQPDYQEYTQPEYVYKSIYSDEELKHSEFYKKLWGNHYREDYKTPIKLKVALLDTLLGGLKPVRKGGGHQTNSLRLETVDGKEYVMRNAKKSALRFIQYFVFKTKYLNPDVAETYFVKLLQDYWTTANPYASLTMADLSDAISVYHANPHIYYIPKQKALGIYNSSYGDQIYFIEERLADGHTEEASLGNAEKMESTSDVYEKLRHKEKVKIDEERYIRTRLFDNIIGDFDRHSDQWRWVYQKLEDGTRYYQPVPRDRDQAFSSFDGFILRTLTTLTPMLRFMQVYKGTYKNIKWFNDAGDEVDRVMLRNDTPDDWQQQADYIKENLTEAVIDEAFKNFPAEVNREKIQEIKQAMLERISKINEQAERMYRNIHKQVIITGTDKEDWFVITRLPGGTTNIKGYRIKDGKKDAIFWDFTYNKKITKEIWIYGLDDNDIFEEIGNENKPIQIKIIGGRNHDTYRVVSSKNMRIFDQKSKPNTFETKVHKTLSDDYDLNTYNVMKSKKISGRVFPLLGYNPDDGLAFGVSYTFMENGLRTNPFTQKHMVKGLYYSATDGLWFDYKGEIANFWNSINFGLEAGFHSPNYTNNFFGLGNETPNFDDHFTIDYNRVRMEEQYISPSLIYRGFQGSVLKAGLRYRHTEIEKHGDRYINTAMVDSQVFDGLDFLSAEVSYTFSNADDGAWPEQGIGFGADAGYTRNLVQNVGFAFLKPEVNINFRLIPAGSITYAGKLHGEHLFGNNFEFYQASVLGASNGLRGYRQQRFSGKSSFYHNSDIRWRLGNLNNGILPVVMGVYAGFDYGRVWMPGEDSSVWHSSPGGGLLFNLAGFTTAHFDYFTSNEGSRFSFGFSLRF